jgi:hypothetical protein
MECRLKSSGAWVVIAGLLSILGCRVSGSITHLIPDGYVGPVVIVFDDPKGEAPKRDENGGVIYEIPPDGVLRLSTPAPEVGFYNISYFYVRPDGARREIPKRVDKAVLQVFAVVDGATNGEREKRPPARWTWSAYIVGVPSNRDDWVQVRGEATSRAIGIPGLL